MCKKELQRLRVSLHKRGAGVERQKVFLADAYVSLLEGNVSHSSTLHRQFAPWLGYEEDKLSQNAQLRAKCEPSQWARTQAAGGSRRAHSIYFRVLEDGRCWLHVPKGRRKMRMGRMG
jgi:hypothetical protein